MGDLLVKHVSDSLVIDGEQVMPAVAEKEQPPTLPTELWIKIFTMAVDPDRLCYNQCTSFDFPWFIEELIMFGASPVTAINDQISKICQVCRLWSRIQEPARKLYIVTENHLSIGTYTDIRILSLFEEDHSGDDAYKPYPLDQALLKATRNLHILTVTKAPKPVGKTFMDNFSSYSGYFQNVQSFHYFIDQFPRDFWSQLEVAFPRLRALMISGSANEADSSVTLPYLEVLDVNIKAVTPPAFSFPSLKHLASFTFYPSCSQILDTHGKELESLLFPHIRITPYGFFGGQFWMRFPKLKLFGGLIEASDGLPPPPTGHPFNHLRIYHLNLQGRQLNLQSVQRSLSYLPSTRYLTIVTSNPTKENVEQLVIIDQFPLNKEANQLEIYLYGGGLDPELHQLRKDGSWQKETCYASSRSHPSICTWELKEGEDYSS